MFYLVFYGDQNGGPDWTLGPFDRLELEADQEHLRLAGVAVAHYRSSYDAWQIGSRQHPERAGQWFSGWRMKPGLYSEGNGA